MVMEKNQAKFPNPPNTSRASGRSSVADGDVYNCWKKKKKKDKTCLAASLKVLARSQFQAGEQAWRFVQGLVNVFSNQFGSPELLRTR